MLRKTMLALGIAATAITGAAIATSGQAEARTDVVIGLGVNVNVPGGPYEPPIHGPIEYADPWTPIYRYHVHTPRCGHRRHWRVRYYERPRWRTRCHRHVRRVRYWSHRHGHWHIKRIRGPRHCHRVRVW